MKKVSNTEQLAGTINKGIRIFSKALNICYISCGSPCWIIVYAYIR